MMEDLGNPRVEQWKKYGYLIIGLLVLVAAALLIKNGFGLKDSASDSQNRPDNLIIPDIVRAEPKKVAEGFPKELNLNSQTEIIGSYAASYPNSSAKQTTVEFISSKDPETNYDFYIKWAEDNEWQILNSAQNNSIKSLYFKKTAEAINITIRPSANTANESNIIISYVNLNQ